MLFAASLDKDATVAIRSCTVDFDCEATKGLFTANEWEELQEHNTFGLPQLPETTVGYILKLRKAMLEGKHVSTVNFPEQDRFSCELAMVTCMKRAHLYAKDPSPFVTKGLSEAFWARTSRPLMKDLLDEVPGIVMVDGEKAGLESSVRRNSHRTGASTRRRVGRKLDLVARNFKRKEDWFNAVMGSSVSQVSSRECGSLPRTTYHNGASVEASKG